MLLIHVIINLRFALTLHTYISSGTASPATTDDDDDDDGDDLLLFPVKSKQGARGRG